MITIQLDGLKAIDHRLESMVEAIDDLQHHGIPDELSEWQRSDVHRKRAFTKHTRSGARTLFRPHSRYESMHRRRFARKLIRRGRFVPRWSTRPILRVVLWDQLVDRMAALAAEKLKW